MKNNLPNIALPFEWLFARLEAAGFVIDTSRKMRLLRLIDAKGSDYVGRWKDLKYLLAPFLAQNEQQQQEFYQLFDAFVEECEQEALPQLIQPTWWQRNRTTLLLTLFATVLLTLAAWGISKWLTPEQQVAVPVQIQAIEDPFLPDTATLILANATAVQEGINFRWEIRSAETGNLLFESPDDTLRWVPEGNHPRGKTIVRLEAQNVDTARINPLYQEASFSVVCAAQPIVRDQDLFPAPRATLVQGSTQTFRLENALVTDSVEWEFPNGEILTGPSVTHTLGEAASQLSVRLRVIRGEHCRTEKPLNYSLGANKPFLSLLPLEEIEPKRSHQYNFWYWLLVLLPLALLPWLYRRWRRQFDREPVKQVRELADLEAMYPIHDQAPYFIPYRDRRNLIRVPAQFFRIADVLRRREEGLRTEFDSKASISATVQAGGYPSWRDRNLSRPAAYLILCQWHEERHQMDRLLGRLVQFLVEQDAPVQLLWHDGSFERVWEQGGESTTLHQWYRNHPGHRLIVLGDGLGLVNQSIAPEPMLVQKRVKPLLQWERRLLLTTRPTADWNWQEALLYQHFHLYPATTGGILDGVEQLDRLEEVQPGKAKRDFESKQQRYPEISAQYRRLDTVEDLRDWLSDDPELFRWLCGLAVTNHPDWSLTIAIGQALGMEVTHDRLLRLARIPWLASNEPSNHLRLDLLRQLSDNDTVLARQCLIDELEAVKEQVQGGFAEVEWTTTLAVQRFALDPKLPEHKQQIRELQQIGLLDMEQEAELEYIVTERADASGVSEAAKEGLKPWLEEEDPVEPVRWITRESIAALILVLLSLTGGILGLSYNLSDPVGPPQHVLHSEMVQTDSLGIYVNEAIRISQRRDSLESWTEWLSREDSLQLAMDLLDRAARHREEYAIQTPQGFPDSTVSVRLKGPLDSARFAILYNYTVKAFNFFLADSSDLTYLVDVDLGDDTLLLWKQEPGNTPFYLHSQHLLGLYDYYLSKAVRDGEYLMDSASACYDRIVRYNPGYFDSLRDETMVVNLETLLGEQVVDDRVFLHARLIDANTGAAVPNARVRIADGPEVVSDVKGTVYYRYPEAPQGRTPGQVTLQVEAEGYPTSGYAFQLHRDSSQMEEIRLRKQELRMEVSQTSGCVPLEVTCQLVSEKEVASASWLGMEEVTVLSKGPGLRTYLFEQAGRYQLVVAITYADGSSDTLVNIPTVRAYDEPAIDITATPRDNDPLTYNIFATTNQDSIDFTWTIEGQTYRIGSPRHTFSGPGTYTIQLSIAGRCGTSEMTKEVVAKQDTVDNFIAPTMISIPGGTFTMGDVMGDGEDDDETTHEVTLRGFQMAATELSFAEYDLFCEATDRDRPEDEGWGRGQRPVIDVDWYDAVEYCNWLSEQLGYRPVYTISGTRVFADWTANGFRLPTEAEWEYAARQAGQRVRFGNGRDTADTDEINFNGSAVYKKPYSNVGEYRSQTLPVRSLRPNSLGLYHMSGNVLEWCWDWYGGYPESAQRNPYGPTSGDDRVLRGGSFDNGPVDCRVAYRDINAPGNRYDDVGFRLTRTP